jgi:hypothetical protein
MSLPTNPAMPSWQNNVYPPYNPYSLDPTQILAAMQNNALTTNIYESTNKTIGTINDAQRLLTSELAGVNKNLYDGNMQNAIAIERNGANNMATTERVNNQLATAVERTSANNQATTERVNSQLATAVERNGANNMATTERINGQINSAVERNGGNIMTAIEKVAGEGRLTTTITDAASRQAANDSARDILRAVDKNGMEAVGVVKDTFTGLLGTIERNAGENRIQTLTSSGILGTALTDVRHSILNDVNRSASDILAASTQSLNVLTKHVTDGAWEGRTAMSAGFQNLSEEHLRTKNDLAQQAAQNYASNLLEGQKNLNFLTSKVDNQFAAMLSKNDGHYASLMLENQKASSLIDNKVDHHYASLLLEQQKSAHFSDSKADNHFAALLSKQDNHFAAILLEQQKAKECVTLQLQEAKYEALKNKQELSKEMAECCCEIKMKVDQRAQDVIGTVDTLDRNRLRDDLNVANNENNVLKILEWYDDRGYDRGGYGRGRGDRGSRGRR